VKKKEGG